MTTLSDAHPSRLAPAAVPMPPANWLFVHTGTSFTLNGRTLSIRGVRTLMFNDRPERRVGDALTLEFVQLWREGADNFESDPPSATLSTAIDGMKDLVVAELTHPRLAGDTLCYDIRPLDGALPAAGKQISVFIDGRYGPESRQADQPWPGH
ncbi:hypothetical protein [Variovorax sp. OV329]|uniref:hypothetical protein n=1 Tax=Variovorax sp. OV329 TaxID=1882825 RepID=UPI0008E595F6|nr:hypothetical protein [Variovorax sp. OV329]SFM92107.1 hypothetical protein SAMN05444747_11139 [Variovorax sp. OV329]